MQLQRLLAHRRRFDNCTFTNCNFFGATFTDCKFVGSMFERCTFDRLWCAAATGHLSVCLAPICGPRSFEDVRMREADLNGARCDGAGCAGST